jgi:Protein kinase domain
MSTVYLARQSDLQRDVALKELSLFEGADPALARRFLREARLAGSLGHPNIVTVYDYLEDRGRLYIAMEYLPGGSLRPHVGRLSLAQIGGVLDGLLNGLAFAEERRVLHRDLKPENVMVTGQGWVKISDFGIAKATSEAQATVNLTTTGTTLGTPRYMAPERAMGEEVGPWSDLYSVGVMSFELLVGRTPFHDTEEPVAVLMRQINETVPPVSSLVPDVDTAISDWVERLLVKDPDARTRSAATAWDDLEEILTSLLGPRWLREAGLPASPGGPATTLRRTPQRATVPPAEQPVAPVQERTEAPLTIPLPAGHPRPRTRAAAVGRRRLGAVVAVLVVGVTVATFAGGAAPRSAPSRSDAAPVGASATVGALGRRTSTHRAQLATAGTGREQGVASRALAGDFSSAARAVEREGGEPRLASALDAAARSYRRAAAAAERGDTEEFARARARARRAEGAIAVPEQSRIEDDSGVGDSRSDDPSDDEPDEEDGGDGA